MEHGYFVVRKVTDGNKAKTYALCAHSYDNKKGHAKNGIQLAPTFPSKPTKKIWKDLLPQNVVKKAMLRHLL